MSTEDKLKDVVSCVSVIIDDVRQRYLVSDVIFIEIKNGMIIDKRGTEISAEFVLQHEHYLGKGSGYIIL